MTMNPNSINGQPLEFGNLEQIEFVRRYERIFSGQEAFHEIEWRYCIYTGHSGSTSKPMFEYVELNKANAVVDHITCPQCQRIHILLIAFRGDCNFYEEMIYVDRATEEGFHCWNCKTEFQAEDRYVFVKLNQE